MKIQNGWLHSRLLHKYGGKDSNANVWLIVIQTIDTNTIVLLFRYKHPMCPWWPLVVAVNIVDPRDNKYLLLHTPVSVAPVPFNPLIKY